MKKVLLTVLILVIVVIAGVASYVKFALPDVGDVSDLHIDITPERVQHGDYLANHVSLCMDCHSTRDWKRFSAPLLPGTNGKGGEFFNEDMGFPGKFYSKNISQDTKNIFKITAIVLPDLHVPTTIFFATSRLHNL